MNTGFDESKRQQWILVGGLGALLLPILFSVYAVTHLEDTVRLQRQAFEIRAHLIEIDSQLKNWFVLILARANPTAIQNAELNRLDNKALAELETEIESLFTQAETFVRRDREQFLRVTELRDKWRMYREEYRLKPQLVNLSRLQELDEKFFDIDDLAFDTISAREPIMIRNMNLLLQIMIFLSFASLTIIAYALFAMRRENANKARIMEEMRLLQEQALQASNLKSKFLATVSHEIRTPLNGIIGLSDLLRKSSRLGRNPSAPAVEVDFERPLIEVIFQSGKTLLRIINDILDYSKIESDQIDFSNVEFSLVDVFNQVVFSLSSKAAEKSIGLQYELDPHLPKTVLGDPDRLAQVLYNLVGNALKFTSVGGVTLKVERQPSAPKNQAQSLSSKLVFTVVDTGIGISGDLKDLFTPFVQIQKTGTSGEPGTGLGLSIAKHLIERMGGAIEAKSEPGVGSRFWFSLELPVIDAEPIGSLLTQNVSLSADAQDAVKPIFDGLNRPRILVAEDNPTNQLIAQSMLGALGADVVTASNGREAVAIFNQSRVDGSRISLVFMDCQMPVMDGFDATRALRAAGYSGPIVALTANASKEDEARSMESGMSGFLAKPITVDSLKRQLLHFLSSRQDEIDLTVYRQLESRIGPPAMVKVVESFLKTQIEFRERLSTLNAAGDLDQLRKLGHRFKSSSESLGAMNCADLCKQLEASSSIDAARILATELIAISLRVERRLKAILS